MSEMIVSPKMMAGPWITEHEIKVVEDCMRNGWYNYDYVERFQREFAAWHGRAYGIMTPNCTTAIHLLLTALGVKDGDQVIAPDCTWIGSVAAISYLRASPVFCDVDPVSWCMDPRSVERSITRKTKAIIAVDLYGNMASWPELEEIAKRHGIPIIEDAAEALGSTLNGVRAGKFGIAGVFSFHRTKTLATGEGGMLLLDDPALYERCMFLRDHGRKPDGPPYFNFEVTYKYMPFNLQAAMGYAQFQRIDELVAKKRAIFQRYQKRLDGIPDILFNPEPSGVFNSVWITGVLVGKSYGLDKLAIIDRMKEFGLPVRPFFYPLSSLPAYPGLSKRYRSRNPVAYDICSRGINLPGALILTDQQIDMVCDGLKKVLGRQIDR
jgi:perosamine synthetase